MMSRFIHIVLLMLVPGFLFAQSSSHPEEIEAIWQQYAQYKEPAIKNRLFKHSDLLPLMQKHVQSGLLTDEIIGYSVANRSIHHLTVGQGKTKILLWSQMHGDEATATMALFDVFNFLAADDRFNAFRARLRERLTLHIVPMLNPDGAQVWTRRNAMNIDLNRDARNLATPEARALMRLGKQLAPDFGFNLHDQSTLYAAGKNTPKPATISFLAPAYNRAKEMNAIRTRAVQVIAGMNKAIQTKIPGQVAKYNDTHDSTCFGDTFQEMGISAILIESGGYPDDPEKQFIRKINFYSLLTALDAIATESYRTADPLTYWSLPDNARNLYDLIIRNVKMPDDEATAMADLGINRNTRISTDYLQMYYSGVIAKIAKLDSSFAYQEIDAGGLILAPGRTKKISPARWARLSPAKELKWLKRGFLYLKWKNTSSPEGPLPGRWLNTQNQAASQGIKAQAPANFLLLSHGKPSYAMVNGFLIDLKGIPSAPVNAMGY